MDSLVMQAAGPLVKGMAGGEVIRDMFPDASKHGVGQLLLYHHRLPIERKAEA